MPEHWTGEILASIAALIVASAVVWRSLLKTLIDLFKEVRDLRKENNELRRQNSELHRRLLKLMAVIQSDRAAWAKERAEMHAQINKLTAYINKLVPYLKRIKEDNRQQVEKIENLLAINKQYRRELTNETKKNEGA